MAKTKISEYDSTSSNNTDIDSINIAEGCAPSGINNAIREVMSHLKDFQTGVAGDDLTVGGNFSVTGTVTIPDNAISGDKVEGGTINAITINTLSANPTLTSGTANGVAYLNGSKVLASGSALTFDGTSFGIGGMGAFGALNVNRYASSPQATLTLGDNGTPANDVGIYFRQTSGVSGFSTAGASFAWYNASPGTGELMRLTSTGLGIGTTSPAVKLDVAGGVNNTGAFRSIASGVDGIFGAGQFASGVVGLGSVSNHPITFNTNLTERARIDSSGNLLVGTTSAYGKISLVANTNANNDVWIRNDSTGSSAACGVVLNASGNSWRFGMGSTANNGNALTWALDVSGANSEKMRLDTSGNLLVGTTTLPNSSAAGMGYSRSSTFLSLSCGSTTSSVPQIYFTNGNGTVGSISTSGSSTTYATSSDYRLKEDWVAVADASTRVNALKPVNFAWKADGKRVDGFLAHELAEVVPEAVTGEKDAVDDEGNPEYQGIDQSKLVPLLTAALQEALAEINALKARLDAANI
jgi:hypothetical protein